MQVHRYVRFRRTYSADEALELIILVLELELDDCEEDDELLELDLELELLLDELELDDGSTGHPATIVPPDPA